PLSHLFSPQHIFLCLCVSLYMRVYLYVCGGERSSSGLRCHFVGNVLVVLFLSQDLLVWILPSRLVWLASTTGILSLPSSMGITSIYDHMCVA
ncbi:mCG1040630, partial [Mus musculus]